MEELKIIKNEKVVVNSDNFHNVYFLQAEAFAILKVINFLCRESELLFNPIDVIKQELSSKCDIDINNKGILYNTSVSCLITACRYLDNNLKICKNDLNNKN